MKLDIKRRVSGTNWLAMDKRSYPIIETAEDGFASMAGMGRLRIDRANGKASIVGPVNHLNPNAPMCCLWAPVPMAVAEEMSQSRMLHLVQEHDVGDSRGGRLGWRSLGYDGDVADWYCWLM